MRDSTSARARRANRRSLWRNRDFVVLRAGQGVSTLGSQMSRVVLPLLVLDLTHSPAFTGLVALLGGLPAVIFALPLGASIDRWDRRIVMVISTAGLAAGTGCIAIAILTHHLSLPQIAVVGAVNSFCASVYGIAESAALPQVVAPDQISTAMAENEATTRTSQLIGPPIGGALFGLVHALPFIADAISSGVLVCALLRLRTGLTPDRGAASTSLWADIAEGLAWVRHQAFIVVTLLLTSGANALLTGIYLLVIVIARNAGASPTAIGLIFTVEAVFAIGSTLLAPALSRRLSMTSTIIGSHWLWVLLFPLYVTSSNILVLGIITGLVFGMSPIRNVILISYQVRLIPTHLRGRVGSVAGLITAGPMPLGSAVCGILLQSLGPRATAAVLTAAALALALVASASPTIRNVPTVS